MTNVLEKQQESKQDGQKKTTYLQTHFHSSFAIYM